MKKTLKFAWLMLFCLPAFVFTACNKDDDEEALFTDYSVLMGKSRQKTIDYMGQNPYADDTEYQIFSVNKGNVDIVTAWYSFFDGIVLDGVVVVESYLSDNISANAAVNYLNSIYDFQEIDEDGWYTYTHKDYLIYYIPQSAVAADEYANEVMYINQKQLDKTKAADFDLKEAIKNRPRVR